MCAHVDTYRYIYMPSYMCEDLARKQYTNLIQKVPVLITEKTSKH